MLCKQPLTPEAKTSTVKVQHFELGLLTIDKDKVITAEFIFVHGRSNQSTQAMIGFTHVSWLGVQPVSLVESTIGPAVVNTSLADGLMIRCRQLLL